MHTCESITDKLLRYESQAVAVALFSLIRSKGSPVSDAVDGVSRKLGDTSGHVTVGTPVVRATGRVRRVLGDAANFQCLVVVVGRVAAAMTHDDRVIHRDFVQVGGVEFALVFYLGVVEEISLHPHS